MSQVPCFKCPRCSRSYEKESTWKRHGYYCRTKNLAGRAHRRRSCIPCIRSKTRCSSTLPKCSACAAKGLGCQYDQDTLQHNLAKEADKRLIEGGSTILGEQFLSNLDDSFAMVYGKGDDLDFDRLNAMNSLQPLTPNDDLSYLMQLSSPSSLAYNSNIGNFESTFAGLSPVADGEALSWLLPDSSVDLGSNTPTSIVGNGSKDLIVKRSVSSAAQMSARLLWNILMSFPLMMQRRHALLPFIHPTMLKADEDSSKQDPNDPLAKCMSLARIWSFRHSQTTSFVWKTVSTELEKWWSSNHTYSNNQLLACQQALLIYTLMRMSEGTQVANPIDGPLLLTLAIVSKTLVQRVGNSEFIYGILHEIDSWEDWIFHESRRRVATVARLINFVVDIDSAVSCYLLHDFVLVPLPAGKSMWEAPNATAWKREFDLATGKGVYGLGTDGKLKNLQQSKDGPITARQVEWQEYLANENEFGTMVMIASSMMEANLSTD